MITLTNSVSYTLIVHASRFIAEAFPCTTQNQARDILHAQKKKYSDSSHVVHAFVLGEKGEISGASDDAEPSGTAGKPILNVLKGKNCTNIIVTVTRYFGGTLLGTGGLVKAYSESCKGVISVASENHFLQELIEQKEFSFKTDYALYDAIKNGLARFNITELKEEFLDCVNISGKIATKEYSALFTFLKDLSFGKILLSL